MYFRLVTLRQKLYRKKLVFYSHAIPVAINLTGPAPSDAILVLLLDEEKLNTVLGQMNTDVLIN